jgi:hypothetical protein
LKTKGLFSASKRLGGKASDFSQLQSVGDRSPLSRRTRGAKWCSISSALARSLPRRTPTPRRQSRTWADWRSEQFPSAPSSDQNLKLATAHVCKTQGDYSSLISGRQEFGPFSKRCRPIFRKDRLPGAIRPRRSEGLFSLVAMYASRSRNCVCAEWNRIGGAR